MRLADGRHVRMVGINSPELGHRGAPDQPLAEAARRALDLLAPPGTPLGLRYARERHDGYGRTLAHLFLADGRNLQREMVRRGLAFAIPMAPNTAYTSCYAAAEQEARRAHRGVWANPYFAPLAAATAPLAAFAGFHLIRGRVTRVRTRGGALWITLDRRVLVRIPASARARFETQAVYRWRGHTLLVRGWAHVGRARAFLSVDHPAAVERQ